MKRRSPEDAPGVVRSHRQRIESPERGKLRVHVPSREIDVGRRRIMQVFRRLGPVRKKKRVAASDGTQPPERNPRHGRIGFGAVVRPHGRRAVFVAHHRPERVVAPGPDARKSKARAVGFASVGRTPPTRSYRPSPPPKARVPGDPRDCEVSSVLRASPSPKPFHKPCGRPRSPKAAKRASRPFPLAKAPARDLRRRSSCLLPAPCLLQRPQGRRVRARYRRGGSHN